MQSWKNEGEAKNSALKFSKMSHFKKKLLKALHKLHLTTFVINSSANETFQDFLKHCAKRYKKFLLSSVVLLI